MKDSTQGGASNRHRKTGGDGTSLQRAIFLSWLGTAGGPRRLAYIRSPGDVGDSDVRLRGPVLYDNRRAAFA